MSFLEDVGSFFAAGADDAALEAAGVLTNSATQQGALSGKYEDESIKLLAEAEAEAKAASGLDAALAQDLRLREKAGQVLTNAEKRALRLYDQAERKAINAISRGEIKATGAIDTAEQGGLGAVRTGRDTAINYLETGRDQGIGAIDSATGEAISGIDTGLSRSLAYFDPYSEAGDAAVEELAALQGLRGPEAQAAARERFKADPGYAFRVSESLKALEGSATARGGLYSGAAMKALQERAGDLAAQEYGNYYGRTSDLASLGYGAAGQKAGLESDATGLRTNVLSQAGRDRADIITGTAGAVSDVTGLASGREADIITGSGAARADISTNAAANRGNIITNFGDRRGTLAADMGQSRADILTGSGADILNVAGRKADIGMDTAANKVNVKGVGLEGRTNALYNAGQAQAGGVVGAANARSQGLNNALSLAGTALSFGATPIKPTSLMGRALA